MTAPIQETDLGAIPLFADLPADELTQLSGLAHPRTYRAGEPVFQEGEDGIGVFVVTSGEFQLRHKLGSGGSQVEATQGPGDVFGLTSILDDGPRRASASAVTDGTCLVLTRMTFRQAVMTNPALAIGVIRAMAKSLRKVSALLRA